MYTKKGHKFLVRFYDYGLAEIATVDTPALAGKITLQGDDCSSLQDEIETLESLSYPRGPFADFEALLDYTLDQYMILESH